MDKRIYLDNAATTKVDDKVIEEMLPFFNLEYGNASSVHTYGQKALEAVNNSREAVAKFLNCKFNEVFFTSGATESNNLVFKGILKKGDHVITSMIEHPSVLETVNYLKDKGVEVDYVPVDNKGIIDILKIEDLIKDNTRLVSIMYVNNEIGTIQPIKEISEVLEKTNKKRKKKIYFHTDAVQAAQYVDCDVSILGVDLLSLSAHKIYGPKGVGMIYIKQGTDIHSIMSGGGQESGLRSGTTNVAGVVGFSKAIEIIDNKNCSVNVRKLNDYLCNEILKIKECSIIGNRELSIPSNINIIVKGIESESLLFMLDMKGIAVSSGSACSSKSIKTSHVLKAMGLSKEQSRSSIRVSPGRFNTEEEVNYFITTLKEIIKQVKAS